MFEKNRDILMCNENHYVTDLKNTCEYPKFISKKYSRETFQLINGELYHSKVEIDRKVDISTLKKEVIFVFGINAVEEIKRILQNKHRESIIIIIEPNPSFFNYALQQKDLTEIFMEPNVLLFVDSVIGNLNIFLQKIFYNFNFLKYLKNTNVYVTHYYREKGIQKVKEMLVEIRQIISSLLFSLGNDLEDNLIGLERNVNNIENIIRSKNILTLKGMFNDIPAVVVAAGPSLNKNIEDLKKNKHRMIVIAVDTIAHKLISEGIEPTFICSIERVHEVFEYFYADVEIPEKSIIVGPPVLDNRVFEISNEIIIPFREGISETSWLQKLLGLSSETAIPMGYSCANVAFSLGHYLGCNPIILVGQDLAYGNSEEETHAYGTKYDVLDEEINKTDDIEFTTGYYGKTVKTTKIWLQFKHWLENEINNLPITVINATEGGAKINFAKQLTLSDAVDTYCQIDIPDVNREIQKVPRYTIDKEYYLANLAGEINLYEEIKNKSGKYRKILSSITIGNNINSLLKLSEDFQLFIEGIIKQPLLLHNLQSVVMQYYWAYNGRLQIMDQEYIKQEIIEQQKLLGTIVEVIERILTILKAQLKHK